MNQRVLKVGAAAFLMAVAGLASAEPRVGQPAGPGLAVDRISARADLAREHPKVKLFEGDARVTRVYGPAFSTGATATDSAEAFLQRYVGVLGVNHADLAPRALGDGLGNAVQLMPRDDGSMTFTMTAYTQVRDGVPVYRSELRALTRNEAGNPLVLVSNATFDLGEFRADAKVAAAPNLQAAAAAMQEALPAVDLMGEGQIQDVRLVIWAGTETRPEAPRLALAFVARTHASAGTEGFGAWEVVADAATGAIISTEDMLCHADVTGRVLGQTTQGIKSAECNPEDFAPMKDLRVTSGAATAFTDANGNFTLTGVASGTVSVSASPRGERFRVYNPSVDAPATSVNSSSPGTAPDIVLNAANTDQVRRAEVNAYIQHTAVRDMIVAASPAYPTISAQTEWRVNVAVGGTCNAYYMPNDSTNFFNAGGGCPNTAYYDVCHHEYGHHLVQTGGSLQDAFGEGLGDCMGVLLSDQPVLGWGFFNDCNNGLRDARNFRSYPCAGEIHDCGQLISGCLWDTRNAMVAAGLADYSTLLKRLTVNCVPLHAGSGSIAPDITIDWLTLDDDDADIGNGTPHYSLIQAGFTPHNMAGPALDLGHIDLPDGVPGDVSPTHPSTFRVSVTGVAATPVDGDASLLMRINGGTETRTPLTRTGVNEYTATIPPTACLANVSFAVTAATSGGPIRNPAGTGYYTAVSSAGSAVFWSDDFSTDRGWSATATSPARPGAWERVVPSASAGAPSADADGDGRCFVTDNRAGEDVDSNTVALYSPVLDARGDGTWVRYTRWVTLGSGAANQDKLRVEINGQGRNSGTWIVLEDVDRTSADVGAGWITKSLAVPAGARTDRCVLRFTISDAGTDTLVEAGVDGVQLFQLLCNSCPADFNGDGFLDFFDYDDYVSCFEGACPPGKTADFNGDGFADFFDYDDFVSAFAAGC